MSLQEQIDYLKAESRFLLSQEMEFASRRTKIEKQLNRLQDELAIKRAIGERDLTEQDIINIAREIR